MIAVVSCLFVVVSTLCLIFSTLPRFQKKDKNGLIREHHNILCSLNTKSMVYVYFFRGGIFFRDSRGCVRGMVHFWIRHPVYSSSQENGVSGQQNWSHSILIYDLLTVMLMKDKSRPTSDVIVSLFSCFQICEGRYEHCWPAGDPPILRLSDPVASDDGHRGPGPEHS